MARINDPFNTMGNPDGPVTPTFGPAKRDTSRRKSSWLITKQAEAPNTKPCKDCKGTGSSGWKNAKNETIACGTCGGFGY